MGYRWKVQRTGRNHCKKDESRDSPKTEHSWDLKKKTRTRLYGSGWRKKSWRSQGTGRSLGDLEGRFPQADSPCQFGDRDWGASWGKIRATFRRRYERPSGESRMSGRFQELRDEYLMRKWPVTRERSVTSVGINIFSLIVPFQVAEKLSNASYATVGT